MSDEDYKIILGKGIDIKVDYQYESTNHAFSYHTPTVVTGYDIQMTVRDPNVISEIAKGFQLVEKEKAESKVRDQYPPLQEAYEGYLILLKLYQG